MFNEVPIQLKGQTVGAIATFRDKTEVKHLAEQLSGVKMYANALRAQSHEFMNKLHVILGLVQLKEYDDLGDYIKDIAIQQKSETSEIINDVKSSVLAGFLLGKQSFIREQGANLDIECNGVIPNAADPSVIHELITIIGNLINNGLDAVADMPKNKSPCPCASITAYLILKLPILEQACLKKTKPKYLNKAIQQRAKTGDSAFISHSKASKI